MMQTIEIRKRLFLRSAKHHKDHKHKKITDEAKENQTLHETSFESHQPAYNYRSEPV